MRIYERIYMKADFKALQIARMLFFINAIIWLVIGVNSLLRISGNNSAPRITLVMVAVLMFGNVGAMILSGLGLFMHTKLAYFFALVVLGVNIILTFTDQFGFLDLATLSVDLVILVLMIAGWKELK